MINLYSGKTASEPIKQVSGQVRAGAMSRSRGFGNSAFQRNLEKKNQLDKDKLEEAVTVFGEDTVRNWKNQSGEIMASVRSDLKDMRQTAIQARAQGDMDSYKRAMQRSLFDKKLLQYGNMLDNAAQGDLIAMLIGAGGNVLGSMAGSQRGQDLFARIFGKKEYNTPLPTGNLSNYLSTPGAFMGK